MCNVFNMFVAFCIQILDSCIIFDDMNHSLRTDRLLLKLIARKDIYYVATSRYGWNPSHVPSFAKF